MQASPRQETAEVTGFGCLFAECDECLWIIYKLYKKYRKRLECKVCEEWFKRWLEPLETQAIVVMV